MIEQENTKGAKSQSRPVDSAKRDIQHAMSQLDGVRDSKKFGEVLDKMFVPTVQAYCNKEKEKPFRRPTQAVRPTKSSAGQRAAAKQRNEAKQRLIQ